MTGDEPERGEMAVVEEQYTERPIATDPQANPVEENPQAKDFLSYVEENLRMGRMGEDPQVIGEGLIKLSGAMEEFSQNSGAHSQKIEEIRQTAQQIQSGSSSQQQAEMLGNATSSAALVIREIQQTQFPNAAPEATDLQEQARNISGNRSLSEQKGEVEAFFEKAADVVEDM